jgi:cell division protein FtsL
MPVLALAVLFSALGVVNMQHRARLLYAANERAQAESRQLDAEHEEWIVQQRVLANPQRIEQTARLKLGMQPATPARTINAQIAEVRS